MTCEKPIKAMSINSFDIDTLETLPDFLLAERDLPDPATGETISMLVRLPAQKALGGGNLDNVFALETNNQAITVPEGQVRAVRMTAVGGTGIMEYADATHPAQFVAIGEQAGQMLCISHGILNFVEPHDYILASDYYAGPNGVPTTDSTSGQLLFTVVSRNKILIRL